MKWSLQMNEWTSAKNKTPWTAEFFMAQSPTIFNFLPAGDRVPITELAEGIACQRIGCCRQSLVR